MPIVRPGLGLNCVPGPRGMPWFTVVPDGVSKVTLDLPDSQRGVTLTVTNNAYMTTRPRGFHSVKRSVWRSADGAVITTIKP